MNSEKEKQPQDRAVDDLNEMVGARLERLGNCTVAGIMLSRWLVAALTPG